MIHGQIVYHDEKPFIGLDSLKRLIKDAFYLFDSLNTTGASYHRADIYELRGGIYYVIDGTFEVYKRVDSSWVDLYPRIYSGYNFGSKKFVYQDELYSFGGYGYWNNHGQVIKFLKQRKEWELLPYTAHLPNGIASWDPPLLKIITTDSIYAIDLSNAKVFHISDAQIIKDKRYLFNSYNYELKDYTLILGDKPFYSIDKENGMLYKSELSPFQDYRLSARSGLILLKENTMICLNKSLDTISTYTYKSQSSFYVPTGIRTQIPGDDPASGFQSSYKWLYILLISTVLMAAIIYGYKRKSSSSHKQDEKAMDEDNIMHPLMVKLEQYHGNSLSQEELDAALEINHIRSPESRRYRRSQLIKEINKHQKINHSTTYINRVRDPEDGRRYLYHIGSDKD